MNNLMGCLMVFSSVGYSERSIHCQICREAPSKPFKYSEQASELSPAQKHDGKPILAIRDSSVVLEPGVRPLDLPAMTSAAQLATVLPFRLHAVLAVRTDQIHSTRFQPSA